MDGSPTRLNKLNNLTLIIGAAAFIVVISLATILHPKEQLLQRENRKAASAPSFSTASLIDGRYGEDLSAHINDNVALRQFWIDTRCFIDEMILMKTEENDILIGEGSRLFAKHFKGYGDDSQLNKNIDEIEKFASQSDIPVSVMIIPSAGSINPEMLPKGSPQENEYEKLTQINSRLSKVCDVVYAFPVLTEHNREYIYFRNDHHWTTLGAYYAYTELAKKLGRKVREYDWENATRAGDFLGTHYAKSRYFKAIPDTITYFPSDTSIEIMKVVGDAQFETERQIPMISTEKLSGYDKYAAFLDGNNAYTKVPGKGSGRILIVKDSFANCMIPLMVDDFEQIGVVDYRNYAYGLSNLAEKENYDNIVILYSYATLETDNRLVYINKPR